MINKYFNLSSIPKKQMKIKRTLLEKKKDLAVQLRIKTWNLKNQS